MRSPLVASVVIACPHCGTRYQVPPETLGDAGRKVACAHCGKAWLAEPGMPRESDDQLFTAEEEAKLDRSFAEEEKTATGQVPGALRQLLPEGEPLPPEIVRSIAEIRAAIATPGGAPKEDATASPRKTKKERNPLLARRQQLVHRTLPAAHLQRIMRVAAFSLLGIVLGGGLIFRTDVVRALPDMAGLYEAIGLKVNTVGLDFSDVSTLVSRRGDANVISVSATIYSVEPRRLEVPPVVVTLLDRNDQPIYQWSVVPRVPDLEPGEVIGVSTELVSPPAGATRVRLSFAERPTRSAVPAQITE